ncbi:apolipoprotein N-acyltransferase [Gelidibacter algens]|uniref:Apolipoprotein N-acyltransferase n=1 Tax=Gelidibacter algens TaxID=49280 RepID=A0A1A7QZ89_9FLAO|nr:apolipoprotein N-acyltransferase [Gelidibacter algens]OBX25330.1 apolipoprotein N-acyltransferase [Gelidibacter algens]RAJ25207.1 apolipoprotein N-acyltransferase [Gelidibacter algens]
MKHLLLAVLSGLLLAFGWPTYGFPVLLFIGFVPILLVERDLRISQIRWKKWTVFGYSYVSFVIWNFITTNWLQYADVFGASFAILVNSLLMALLMVLYHSVAKRAKSTISLLFLMCLWMSFEKLHLGWDFSWPWLNLGNGFSEYFTWIQWYEYTGTFGGTLWVWIVNILIYKLIIKYQFEKSVKNLKKDGIIILCVVCLPIIFSLTLYYTYTTEGEQINVIALQPNIDPYSEKYNVPNEAIADLLLQLTNNEITEHTDLVVAPETVFADNVKISQLKDAYFKRKLDLYISKHPNLNILTGISFINFITDASQIKEQSNYHSSGFWYDDYNSAMMLNTSDSIQLYHKSKLVVGVETLPYKDIIKPLIGDFMIDLGGTLAMKTTQDARSVFVTENPNLKVGPIICYESVYGEFVTGYVRNGATVLAIVTNDAWWGETQGHKQHLSYARLRAIETRRDIVRSANTGISAFINAKGDITSSLAYGTQGALSGTLTTNDKMTFYTWAGDYIARIAIFIAIFVFLITMFRKSKIS